MAGSNKEAASRFITHAAADPIMRLIFVTGTRCAGLLINVDIDSHGTIVRSTKTTQLLL